MMLCITLPYSFSGSRSEEVVGEIKKVLLMLCEYDQQLKKINFESVHVTGLPQVT